MPFGYLLPKPIDARLDCATLNPNPEGTPLLPDSLLTAAKVLAEESGLPWPRVQRVYRELQADEILPRSAGRAVWYASGPSVARLILGILGDQANHSASETVRDFSDAVGPQNENLIDALARELTGETRPTRIAFRSWPGTVDLAQGGSSRSYSPTVAVRGAILKRQPRTTTDVSMDPRVLEGIRQRVTWRSANCPPKGPPERVEGEE